MILCSASDSSVNPPRRLPLSIELTPMESPEVTEIFTIDVDGEESRHPSPQLPTQPPQNPQPRPLRLQSCLHLRSEVRISSSGCVRTCSVIKSPKKLKRTLTQTLSPAVSSTYQAASTRLQCDGRISPSPSGTCGVISAVPTPPVSSTPSTDSKCTFRSSPTSRSIPPKKRRRSESPTTEPTPTPSRDSRILSDETMSEDGASSSGTKSHRRSRATYFQSTEEAAAALRRESLFLRTLTVRQAFAPDTLRTLTRLFSDAGTKLTYMISSSQLMHQEDLDALQPPPSSPPEESGAEDEVEVKHKRSKPRKTKPRAVSIRMDREDRLGEPTAVLMVSTMPTGIKRVVYTADHSLGSGRYSKVYPISSSTRGEKAPFASECVKTCINVNDWLAPMLMNHPHVMPAATIYSKAEFCIRMPRLTMTLHDFVFSSASGKLWLPVSKEEKSAMLKAVVLGVLKAIEYMNSLGLYHNDIKPANVLLTPYPFDVKLSDFSLTTYLPQPGTVHFSAPEVATSDRNSTVLLNADVLHQLRPYRTDVWSAAMLAFAASARNREMNSLIHFSPSVYPSPSHPDNHRLTFKPNWQPSKVAVQAVSFAPEDTFCEKVFRLGTAHFTERLDATQVLDQLVKANVLTGPKRQNLFPIDRTSCFVTDTFTLSRKGTR
ncbi:protein ORF104 [Cyprinid herpesvirus 3]|uniref:ORF104R n=1 Tax=Cyprinid herpesvirus 3 TaxID=180230 RepID=A0A060IBP5_CYHV3|nr:ORF104R [Cyprinid herpesvirus 3]AVL28034.1 protein ORF104 [Cyprinid herpesvirus 3]